MCLDGSYVCKWDKMKDEAAAELKGHKIWEIRMRDANDQSWHQFSHNLPSSVGICKQCIQMDLILSSNLSSGDVNESHQKAANSHLVPECVCWVPNNIKMRSFFVFQRKSSLPLRFIKCFSLCLIPGDPALVLCGVRFHVLRLHQRRVSENDCLHT